MVNDLTIPNASAAFLLLDRSGSMATLWDEALGSINGYAAELAKSQPHSRITLAVFDNLNCFEVLRDNVRAIEWAPVTDAEAAPRGGTPLYDAIVRLCAAAKKADYDKTSIIIMTDGYENSSREATKSTAKSALDAARDRQWDVVFLGADFDAMAQAHTVGTQYANTLNVARGSTHSVMRNMAERHASYSVGATIAGSAFTPEDWKRAGWKKDPAPEENKSDA